MMDKKKAYQKACKEIVDRRVCTMIESLGLKLDPNANYDAYYGLVDFEFWARKNIGEQASRISKRAYTPA